MPRTARSLFAVVLAASLIALGGCGAGSADDGGADASRIIEEPDAGLDAGLDAGMVSACLDPPTPSLIGQCRCQSDCAVGSICAPEAVFGFPNGKCQRACLTAADCGPMAICKVSSNLNFCRATCATATDCGPGTYCFASECFSFCQRDTECLSGHCNHSNGKCVAADFVPVGKRSSEPCLRGEDCLSGDCSSVCVTTCARSAQGCPTGEFCLGPSSLIDVGRCVPFCATTAECHDPTASCTDVTDLGRSARVCW